MLISEADRYKSKRSLYVANPFSQQCVEILPHPKERSFPLGIATRTENGILLDYKIVLNLSYIKTNLSLLIYSSKTGLWSINTVHVSMLGYYAYSPISLHGTIHWLVYNSDREDVLLSLDLYATGAGSVHCGVTPFPDSGKHLRFGRSCTTCQGFVMYMNIISVIKVDGSVEDKLCVWRLKSGKWQLESEITPAFIETGLEYNLLGINPFDAKTVYFWRKEQQSLISINLRNGTFELHSELERNRDGRIESTFKCNSEGVNMY